MAAIALGARTLEGCREAKRKSSFRTDVPVQVCLASKGAPGLHTLGQGDRQWVRNASKVYNLEKLYRQSGVEFAVVRPWRPSWAPLAAAVRVHVGRLQVGGKQGGTHRYCRGLECT